MGFKNLRTIKQAVLETPFTMNQYRWWIFNAEENGFDAVIRRINGSIFLDLDELEPWIIRKTEEAHARRRQG